MLYSSLGVPFCRWAAQAVSTFCTKFQLLVQSSSTFFYRSSCPQATDKSKVDRSGQNLDSSTSSIETCAQVFHYPAPTLPLLSLRLYQKSTLEHTASQLSAVTPFTQHPQLVHRFALHLNVLLYQETVLLDTLRANSQNKTACSHPSWNQGTPSWPNAPFCIRDAHNAPIVVARPAAQAAAQPSAAAPATPSNRPKSPSPQSPSRPTTATASSTQSSSTSWSGASSSPARTPPPCPTASPPTAAPRPRPEGVTTSGTPCILQPRDWAP